MSKNLTITERDGAVDLHDIVFTIEGQSCTAQMVFDAFKSARLKVAEQAQQIAELQRDKERWPVTYISCPFCRFTHDTEGESVPMHCHACHKEFGLADVILAADAAMSRTAKEQGE